MQVRFDRKTKDKTLEAITNLVAFLTKWKFVRITKLVLLFEKRIHLNLFCPNSGRREKIKLNFYFRTSLWCLKRFYEGLKGLHKTF